MTKLINEKKLIEIFISCDDFDKMYETWLISHTIGKKTITRKPDLSDSEIMTILVFYRSGEPSLVWIQEFSILLRTISPDNIGGVFSKNPHLSSFCGINFEANYQTICMFKSANLDVQTNRNLFH